MTNTSKLDGLLKTFAITAIVATSAMSLSAVADDAASSTMEAPVAEASAEAPVEAPAGE